MATLCLCAIALLAYTVGEPTIGAVAVVMVGALLGFLRFNNHPARVFMGDGGSQVLGFAAACLAVLLTQNPNTLLSTALPLLLLGMPIIDTLMVMTERLLRGHSPFLADRRHIHYRLLALGLEHWEAVSVLYLLQGGLFVTAWFLRYDSDLPVIVSFVAYAALVILPLRLAEHRGLRLRRQVKPPEAQSAETTAPEHRNLTVAQSERQHRALDTTSGLPARPFGQFGPAVVLTLALTAYAGWVLIAGARPSHDMRALALALAVVLAAGLALRWRSHHAALTDKIALYSCAALVIFLRKQDISGALWLHGVLQLMPITEQVLRLVLYGLLAWGVLVSLQRSAERSFRLTPLDILVVLVVVTVPNLPNSAASTRSLGFTVAELVLLFYAVEALGLVAGSRWRWLSAAAVLFLVGVALRASV
jgi:UDP-GlcNAc:undecaprenyl-phosphate GlcNAc-1-phosphate transferase